jgi:hypothetical protein
MINIHPIFVVVVDVKCSSMYACTYFFFHVWKILFEGIMTYHGVSLPTEMSAMLQGLFEEFSWDEIAMDATDLRSDRKYPNKHE